MHSASSPASRLRRHRRVWWTAAGLCAAIASAACSAPAPSSEEAARAITASRPFQEVRWEAVPARQDLPCAEAVAARPDWSQWTGLGLAQAQGAGSPLRPACQLVLAEAVRLEAADWSNRLSGAPSAESGELVLPVAERTFVRITGIWAAGGGTAEARFDWQWRPNQAGFKLAVDTSVRSGVARLIFEQQGWRAVDVRTRE